LFANVNDVSRAVAIVQRMVELNKRFAAYAVTLVAPEPIASASGRYLLPVNAQGQLTGWAEKALSAQVGNIAGEQAGAAAARGLGSVIPGGGLAGGFLKKKARKPVPPPRWAERSLSGAAPACPLTPPTTMRCICMRNSPAPPNTKRHSPLRSPSIPISKPVTMPP
jgi:hypothetical protein